MGLICIMGDPKGPNVPSARDVDEFRNGVDAAHLHKMSTAPIGKKHKEEERGRRKEEGGGGRRCWLTQFASPETYLKDSFASRSFAYLRMLGWDRRFMSCTSWSMFLRLDARRFILSTITSLVVRCVT